MVRRLAITALLFATSCASVSSFDRLAPIASATQSELRINIAHYPSAARTAYVVSRGSIVRYDYNGWRWTVRSADTSTADRALDSAAALERFNGQDISCGLVDGSTVSIDAILDGRRFSLAASNADLCGILYEDERARSIHALIELIDEAADTADAR